MLVKNLIDKENAGLIASILVAVFLMAANTAIAQEHPAGMSSKGQATKMQTVTKDSLLNSITDYINKESKIQGGYFLYYDKIQDKPLALTFEDVHKDRFGDMGNGSYFACADFKDKSGNTYDMDIFMKQGKSGLEASDVSVHKQNGEARYDWVEKDGIWSRKAK